MVIPFLTPELYLFDTSYSKISDYLVSIMMNQLNFDNVVQPDIECDKKLEYDQ